MKIGFYLQNANITNVDCSNPMSGNPGIGGTEYLFISTAYALFQHVGRKSLNYDIVLIANNIVSLPTDITVIEADDKNLWAIAKRHSIDIIVVRYSLDNYHICTQLIGISRIIMWTHNFVRRSELNILSKDENIVAIVCVGSEQLNMYRDHNAFKKSVVIFNGYPIDEFIRNEVGNVSSFADRGNEVTFLGSLVWFKGFHLLAAAWKRVLESVPDAHLNVIGGGKLYDRNRKLGKYGIAEQNYEQSFMPFLTDDDGIILPSITFHGVLGNEKKSILNKTKVGVPNPSGVSETFCIAALELQLWGAVIATINYGGFKDTVYKSGVLYDDVEKLASSIVRQLKSTDNDFTGFMQFAKKFDFRSIVDSWILLFSKIENDEKLEDVLKPEITADYKHHELNRRIKKAIPFGRLLPSMMFYRSIISRLSLKK